jgi:hypothetical protein
LSSIRLWRISDANHNAVRHIGDKVISAKT